MTNEIDPPRPSLLRLLVFGAAAGLLAGVAMLSLMAALRLFFGVATATETIFDRLFPFLTVKFFIGSLVRAGGYSQLKLQGVYGALAGQLGTAAFGGVVYALFVGRFRGRGWRLVVPGVVVVWAVIVALLWPQLLTNYHGRPPAAATALTCLGLLLSFAVCGAGIVFFYALLTGVRPTPAPAGETTTVADLTRRRFLAGGLGALFAVALGGMLRRLYQLGTFHYDGTQYGGP
ncbi:MAG: hypothetical protein INR62_05695, partial [Rhodospirillales bacterium]|nr:hypothetical protein [Acetobacter sp.]